LSDEGQDYPLWHEYGESDSSARSRKSVVFSFALKGGPMLFMVIERFKNRDAVAVYRRSRDQGRMMPEGLKYVGSWIEANFDRCFQLMECDDPRLFQQWVIRWQDLIEFEIVPVVPSKETMETITPML